MSGLSRAIHDQDWNHFPGFASAADGVVQSYRVGGRHGGNQRQQIEA